MLFRTFSMNWSQFLIVTLLSCAAARAQTSDTLINASTPSSTHVSSSNDILQSINAAGSTTPGNTLLLPKFATLQQSLSTSEVILFLPSESAIQQAVSDGSLNLTTTQNTTNILSYHLVSGRHLSNTFNTTQFLASFFKNETFVKLGGSPQVLGVSLVDSSLQVTNGLVSANIIKPDIQCSNGIVHVIDNLLLPPKNAPTTITQIPELEAFANITQNNNLTGTLTSQQATIFAPNNGAWNQLGYLIQPAGILLRDVKYEIVRGVYRSTDLQPSTLTSITGQVFKVDRINGNITINGAHIIRADILTSDGVIHIIDNVIEPTASTASIAPSFSSHYLSTPSMIQSTLAPKSSAGMKRANRWIIALIGMFTLILS
ncbi:FAS1 domain-containing protein [Umbelopsis sp. PMI_123]|nr:FAS1 domain-containing protein [Umbelopsis sp. PMI_123]